ncbi:MAG: histidine kinase dimerization/phospho-acceptor domain-containing protein [Longimicrobiales bacterium]
MSAVLAHEIRNPLTSLKGHAQLLAERLDDSNGQRRRADRIVAEAQRLESLTSDLLDFARSGPIDLQPARPVELLESSVHDVDPDGFNIETRGAPASWRRARRHDHARRTPRLMLPL